MSHSRAGARRAPWALALALAATAGCTVSGAEVIASTRPMKAGEGEVLGKATGTSWAGYVYVLNFIPIHFGDHDCAGRARDAALEGQPGADALRDAVMDQTVVLLPIPLLHVILTITDVEGDAVKTAPARPPAGGRGQ